MFSTGLSSGDLDGGDERHIFEHAQLRGGMPPGLIYEQNGVSAGLDGKRDLLEVQRHGLGVAGRKDETGRLAERATDGAEDIGRGFADPLGQKGACRVPPNDA
jgi:hypothetical protein